MRLSLLFIPVLFFSGLLAPVVGDDPKPKTAKAESKDGIGADRERAALEFAEAHHEELAQLLMKLKDSNHREYDKAIVELSKTSERLARIKERTPKLYDSELAAWKLDSRIRLLQARMTMVVDADLDRQLRDLLTQRAEARLKKLRAEKTQLEDNLRRVDQRIAETEKSLGEGIDKELALLKQRAAKGRESRLPKTDKTNAATAKTPKTSKKPEVKAEPPKSPEKKTNTGM